MRREPRHKRGILTAIILTIAIVFQQPVYVTAEEAPLRLYAKAAVLMDADSGRCCMSAAVMNSLPWRVLPKL